MFSNKEVHSDVIRPRKVKGSAPLFSVQRTNIYQVRKFKRVLELISRMLSFNQRKEVKLVITAKK